MVSYKQVKYRGWTISFDHFNNVVAAEAKKGSKSFSTTIQKSKTRALKMAKVQIKILEGVIKRPETMKKLEVEIKKA